MTTDKETLAALLERVRAATGPDRELDEQIALATCDEHEFAQLANAPVGTGCMMYRHGHSQMQSALRVTSSIDAALALTERVLPGWKLQTWSAGVYGAERPTACLMEPDFAVKSRADQPYLRGQESAETLVLAIIAATLSALIAQGQTP